MQGYLLEKIKLQQIEFILKKSLLMIVIRRRRISPYNGCLSYLVN